MRRDLVERGIHCLAMILLLAPAAGAQVIRVPADHATIQAAIDAAIGGDSVLVADGVWTGTGNVDLHLDGKAITVASESGNPAACVIDCEGTGRGFTLESESAGAVIRGFTVRDGSRSNGGGVRILASDLTFADCIVTGCVSGTGRGGGIWIGDSSAQILNCLVADNDAHDGGGGIHIRGDVEGKAPSLRNCTIANNTGNDTPMGLNVTGVGGAEVIDCIIWDNDSYNIHVDSWTPFTISYSDVEGGYAGVGMIDADPLFASGPYGDTYLGQTAAGQAADSPGLDAGSAAAASICFGSVCLDELTTRTDGAFDAGQVDMGAHYLPPPPPTPTPSPTPTHVPTVVHVPAEFATIQAAVDWSIDGDTILVADGIWTGTGNVALDFGGKAITVASESGDPTACVIDGQDAARGFRLDAAPAGTVVRGFTVRNGHGGARGGAMYITDSILALEDCIFADCTATDWGGALAIYNSTVQVFNCLMTGNRSDGDGGAVYIGSNVAQVSFVNCTVTQNSCGDQGDGLWIGSPAVGTVVHSVLWGNGTESIYTQFGSSLFVSYSDVQGGYLGVGNFDAAPLFASGLSGDFYLSQTAAGQAADSPCLDAGGVLASVVCFDGNGDPVCLDQYTTRTDDAFDAGQVDAGFHYLPPPPPPLVPAAGPLGLALLALILGGLTARRPRHGSRE